MRSKTTEKNKGTLLVEKLESVSHSQSYRAALWFRSGEAQAACLALFSFHHFWFLLFGAKDFLTRSLFWFCLFYLQSRHALSSILFILFLLSPPPPPLVRMQSNKYLRLCQVREFVFQRETRVTLFTSYSLFNNFESRVSKLVLSYFSSVVAYSVGLQTVK